MNHPTRPPSLWDGQLLHLLSLAVLLVALFYGWHALGAGVPYLFWIAVSFPIGHQLFVWLSWRVALNAPAGRPALGFKTYLVFFFAFFLGRFASLALLAGYDEARLGLNVEIRMTLVAICLALGAYAIYSVERYFGMSRAAGGDHFNARYRDMPHVNEGIFRFTKNGMYVYAFLLFWSIPFFFDSAAALLVVAFSHLYIWVHFYATEKPDMDYLYG
ncbi:MAG: hypothetical protein BMS9Abin05_2331 [Rhodothermia bacterium]|nr:MAG: hypothetical protein BMS9Abin05_2331 [Rhodothermia bacterium]